MIEIGDTAIALSPKTLVLLVMALVALLGTVLLLIVRSVSSKLRTGGARLAIRKARQDFPNEKVVSSSVVHENGKKYATLTLSDGRTVRYLIVDKDELAFKVDGT